MIKLSDIRIGVDAPQEALREAAARQMGVRPEEILSLDILREAVDARHRGAIRLAYVLAVEVADEAAALRAVGSKAEPYAPPAWELPLPSAYSGRSRPVVVGAGPAGLFAAWVLARAGMRPIVVERGQPVPQRRADVNAFFGGGPLNEHSNVQFGEGGAGAFSDGKLVTRIKDPRCAVALRALVAHGAPQEILYSARAHVGTDKLWNILPSLRVEIEKLGGEYRFGWALEGLDAPDGRLHALVSARERIETPAAVLAIGHSARDTVEALHRGGLILQAKPFAVGFRIEHPQRLINRAVYGGVIPRLGAADYHVSAQTLGRPVYSFCMCPGGSVVNASSEAGRLAVNGMSLYARAGHNANSAVVAGIKPEELGEGPLAGIALQRRIEEAAYSLGGGWTAPAQRLEDYVAGRPSRAFGAVSPTVRPAAVPADLNAILPKTLNDAIRASFKAFDRHLAGFALHDAVLTAVESRTSSPVRMPRRDDGQAEGIDGLYPAGEGAGYAGGILSAAVDGMKAAEAVIRQWRD